MANVSGQLGDTYGIV